MAYQTYIKSQYSAKSLQDVLTSPTNVLLGVSDAAATALAKLDIQTVFDLAVSVVFDNAARIVAASENPRSVMRRYGRAASTVVGVGVANADTPDLPYDEIDILIGVGAANKTALEQQLSVVAIRDLVYWPPFLAAKAIMLEAYNPRVELDRDPEAPPELLPKSGEFGTERYLYSSVVMFPGPFGKPAIPLKGVLFDMTMTPTPEYEFDTVRYGARLTYSHTWTPMAVAKGHLLHSLPLAPGESTNVAVIAWTNKSSASTQQALSESERLNSTSDHARTVSQIADSVAHEYTSGSSVTVTESMAGQAGVGGILGFFTGSGAVASNEQVATTHTVSTGERDIATTLRQNIQDSTQQISSSMRSERAASVSEVNQAQSEKLSTRSVTNYNHMHALTVQYYEVVQVYETETRLENAERCIFLPMKPIDFTDVRNIVKYLPILKAVALDGTTRALLAEVEENPSGGYALAFNQGQRMIILPEGFLFFYPQPAILFGLLLAANARDLARDGFIVFSGSLDNITLDYQLQLNNVRWTPMRSVAPTTPITQLVINLDDGTTVTLPTSAAANADPKTVNNGLNSGALSFGRIRGISVMVDTQQYIPRQFPPNSDDYLVKLELAVELGNEARWLDCSFMIDPSGGAIAGKPVYTVSSPSGLTELGEILNESKLYYSQQIWMREDPQSRIMQLAPFRIAVSNNRYVNLVDYLPPEPLQVVGNYLVYRYTYENDATWVRWRQEHFGADAVSVDIVPVPTGGVFAEAVLGRANAAEKLDATRFFDWQDSPPPKPPGIQPLKTGTHTPADAPPIGDFAKPVVNIQTPVSLPDPVGLSALLTAITTSDAFRNMSGLSASGDAANQALDASSKGATNAMQAAGAALASTLSSLADAFGGVTSEKGLSTLGSLINQKQADQTKATDKTAPASGANAKGAAATKAQQDLVNQGLEQQGVTPTTTATGATPGSGTGTGAASGSSDAAVLGSTLITEPMFADVSGFVTLLQSISDDNLIGVMRNRFSTLDKTVDPLQKYNELIATINSNSATLQNPARFEYAAQFVKTGALPDDTAFDLGVVGRLRKNALALAVDRVLSIANTINGADTAKTALSAILDAGAAQGVTDVNAVSYVLATAHHESAMGKYTTEIANGVSTDTVFTRDAYFFNAIPGKKSSYNTLAGNTKAGDALKAAGTITQAADVTMWNGAVYPDSQPTAVKVAARTCDFIVYIGRGYVQLTGRANYHNFSNVATLGNVDLEANPERVTEPAIAAGILVMGMKAGSFRGGHKLADYDIAAGWDATNARDIINGDKATYGAPIRDVAKQYKLGLVQFPKLDESKKII
jgi:hypothetical protein